MPLVAQKEKRRSERPLCGWGRDKGETRAHTPQQGEGIKACSENKCLSPPKRKEIGGAEGASFCTEGEATPKKILKGDEGHKGLDARPAPAKRKERSLSIKERDPHLPERKREKGSGMSLSLPEEKRGVIASPRPIAEERSRLRCQNPSAVWKTNGSGRRKRLDTTGRAIRRRKSYPQRKGNRPVFGSCALRLHGPKKKGLMAGVRVGSPARRTLDLMFSSGHAGGKEGRVHW